MSTKWGHILSRVAFEFNCIIGKTHILSERGTLYNLIYIYYIYKYIYIVTRTQSRDGPGDRCLRDGHSLFYATHLMEGLWHQLHPWQELGLRYAFA